MSTNNAIWLKILIADKQYHIPFPRTVLLCSDFCKEKKKHKQTQHLRVQIIKEKHVCLTISTLQRDQRYRTKRRKWKEEQGRKTSMGIEKERRKIRSNMGSAD